MHIRHLLPAAALALSACLSNEAQEPASTPTEAASVDLPLERLFQSPSLSGPSPRAVAFSPDGALVTFLRPRDDEQDRLDLWAYRVETGEAFMLVDSKILEPEEVELSEAEKALRERKRIAGTKGIVQYDWDSQGRRILVPLGGDLHLVELGGDAPKPRRLTETEAFEYDARISPAGGYVSFIREGALYAIDLTTGEEQRLTPEADPDKAISYGVAEFVAQEEMSRYTGYWWAAEDKYIAYTRVDESTGDIIPRFDIAADEVTVIDQRYPRAGRPNAVVDLFVRDMASGDGAEVAWRREEWGPATDQYLARGGWNGEALTLQIVYRDQTEIRHLSAWPGDDWATTEFLTERQPNWVNLAGHYRYLEKSRTGIATTEETGFRHIVARSEGDSAFRTLTSGDWVVSAIEGVDKDQTTVFFTGYKDTPLERHLYSVPLAGGEITRITEPGRSWSASIAPDGASFVGTSSAPDQPPQTGLYRADGSLITWIEENVLDAGHPYAPYLDRHTLPEYGTLAAEDGQTLYYSIQTPPDFDPGRRYPAIVEVYGGPHVQRVTRNWESLSDQYLTQQGYIVFRLDNRGSYNRGKAFEDVIHRRTGGPEVRDQLVGVEWLKSQPFVDPDRIGIQGWSYGGYMTLMTVLQAPEGTFAAAVSGAPVSDWTLYDTFYTERYMDTPQNNPEGYEASSVFPYLENLATPLLLIHGMADDNVTFDNSTRVYAELQEMGKSFEMMTYPGKRHGIRGEALGIHLMRTRMEFLNRLLKGE